MLDLRLEQDTVLLSIGGNTSKFGVQRRSFGFHGISP